MDLPSEGGVLQERVTSTPTVLWKSGNLEHRMESEWNQKEMKNWLLKSHF